MQKGSLGFRIFKGNLTFGPFLCLGKQGVLSRIYLLAKELILDSLDALSDDTKASSSYEASKRLRVAVPPR